MTDFVETLWQEFGAESDEHLTVLEPLLVRLGTAEGEVGDVARMANLWHEDSPRIEHWTNAVEQGVHVVEQMLGGSGAATSFSSVPYFWSDQYDRKIQFVGRARLHDEMLVVDGSVADRRLTALYRRGDRVVACLTVNQPRALIKSRKLLASKASWDAALTDITAT